MSSTKNTDSMEKIQYEEKIVHKQNENYTHFVQAFREVIQKLKEQNGNQNLQIQRLNDSNHDWQQKYNILLTEKLEKSFTLPAQASPITNLHSIKQSASVFAKIQQDLRRHKQMLNKVELQLSKKREDQTKLFQENRELKKELSSLKTKDTFMKGFTQQSKVNEPLILKIKQFNKKGIENSDRRQVQEREDLERLKKELINRMSQFRDIQNRAQDRQRNAEEERQNYSKLKLDRDSELAIKQAEIAKCQRESIQFANAMTSLNIAVSNLLVDLTSFDKILQVVDPEKKQLKGLIVSVNIWKGKQQLPSDWQRTAKQLISTLSTSIRRQKARMKKAAEEDSKLLNEKITALNRTISQNEQSITQLNKQINDKNKSNGILLAQNNNTADKLKQKTFQADKLRREKTSLQQNVTDLSNKFQSLKYSFEQLNAIKQKQLKTIRTLTSDTQEWKTNSSTLSNKLQEANKLKTEKETTIKQLANINSKLNTKLTSLNSQNDQLKHMNASLEQRVNLLTSQGDQHRRNITSHINTISSLKQEILELKQTVARFIKTIEQLEKENRELKQAIDSQQRTCASLQNELKDNEENQHIFSEFASALAINVLNRNQQINVKQAKLPEIAKDIINLYKQARFFNGSDIIARERVTFIVDALENFTNFKCKSTKLIYRTDPQNTSNFHTYIDKKDNLLVVVKISNGTIIGGFTNTTLQTGVSSAKGKGFCFNLNHKRIFRPRFDTCNQNVTTYDSFYFILGNAEIRLRTGEKKVFSNFGIAKSYFDPLGFARTDFLGVDKPEHNELDIDSEEFYEIDFEYQ